MPIILTSPLQKNIPLLASATQDGGYASSIAHFIQSSEADILLLLVGLDRSLDILAHQKSRCGELIASLEEAGGLTVRARNMLGSPSPDDKKIQQLKEFETWFQLALNKLDADVTNSTYHDINLMTGGSLITPFDTQGENELVTQGIPLTAHDLGIRPPDFSTLFTTQNSRIDVMNAIDMVVTLRNIIAAHETTISISRDFAIQTLTLAAEAKASLLSPDHDPEAYKLTVLANLGQHILGDEPLADPPQHDILSNFAASPKMEEI